MRTLPCNDSGGFVIGTPLHNSGHPRKSGLRICRTECGGLLLHHRLCRTLIPEPLCRGEHPVALHAESFVDLGRIQQAP